MRKTLPIIVALGMLLSVASLAEAGSVTLGWDPNTETDLAGYRLYYGSSPRAQAAYTHTVPINNKSATTWQLTLPTGVYYFGLTAVDLVGNESGFSNEVIANISDTTTLPGKPGIPVLIQ